MTKLRKGRSTAAVDAHIGARIRRRRVMLGLTLQQLGEEAGTNYRQLHKYERGTNRVSAALLYQIARALKVSVLYFFEGLDEVEPRRGPRERMLLAITRNFSEIQSKKYQEAFCQLTRALAGH